MASSVSPACPPFKSVSGRDLKPWTRRYWILRVAAKDRHTPTSSNSTPDSDSSDQSTTSAEERSMGAEDKAKRLKERLARLDRAAPPKRLTEWKAGALQHNCLTPASLTGNMIWSVYVYPAVRTFSLTRRQCDLSRFHRRVGRGERTPMLTCVPCVMYTALV